MYQPALKSLLFTPFIILVFLSSFISSTESYAIELTAQESAYLKQKQQINMCIDPDWMPLEKNDQGKHVGMSSDYITLMEKEIGIPIVLMPTSSWVETVKFAKNRRCDIVSMMMSTSKRREYMNFTSSYLTIPLVVASKTEQFFIANLNAIKGKKLGVVRGYAFGEILREEYPNMDIVDVDSLHQGLEMVNQGELYGFVDSLVTIGYEFQRNFVGELKIIGKFDRTWELGVATRNDEPLLFSVFEKSIKTISEKQKQAILNQWLAIRYEKVIDYGDFWKWLIALLVLLSFFIYRNYLLEQHNRQLERISITDKLTQIYNRVKLDSLLARQEALYERYKQKYSIVIIDIDYFKRVNDKYGHQAGDEVLQEFAKILKENIRTTDILGRWGGEEFMLISPKTSLDDAAILAEKLRDTIENKQFSFVGSLTSSFGVSERGSNGDTSLTDLVSHADQALYQAKDDGRNRVVKFNKHA
jgi:polar amino acid transport system substrate-binding protein